MLFNLCAEKEYDAHKFEGRAQHIPFLDHTPPSLRQIKLFCHSVCVCVCVNIYVLICIQTYIYIHTNILTYMHTCMYTCMHARGFRDLGDLGSGSSLCV